MDWLEQKSYITECKKVYDMCWRHGQYLFNKGDNMGAKPWLSTCVKMERELWDRYGIVRGRYSWSDDEE